MAKGQEIAGATFSIPTTTTYMTASTAPIPNSITFEWIQCRAWPAPLVAVPAGGEPRRDRDEAPTEAVLELHDWPAGPPSYTLAIHYGSHCIFC